LLIRPRIEKNQRQGEKIQMKSYITLVLVLVASTTAMAFEFEKVDPASAGFDAKKLDTIKANFEDLYQEGRIPNYVMGVYSGDKSIYLARNGSLSIEGGTAVDENTIYWLASMTKPLVSTAILRLQEEGKLNLDDKLSKYFPAFADMLVAPGGSYAATLEPAKTEITLRHLITHTSGLTYGTNVSGVGDVAEQYDEFGVMSCITGSPNREIESLEGEVEFLSQLPLIDHPGASWNYSVGIDVLGAVIEQITKKRLSQYLDEIIFTPLNMRNTTFSLSPDQLKRTAGLYLVATPAQQASLNYDSEIPWKLVKYAGTLGSTKPVCDSGGGGLWASIDDYAIYLTMIANDGELNGVRVLSKESVVEHLKDQTTQLMPEAFRRGFGEDASSYMKFSAGFGRKLDVDTATGVETVDYYFWGGAANTFFWMDKENNTVGVFATHLMPSLYNKNNEIEEIVDQAVLR
jgi:CubicO group peptidase (beta-lactamase class C family)